jgi:ADP-heptose:LPS heptosyltransferase
MRTLVINLTRFGDLIQTQPVLSGLAMAGDVVGLLCLDSFQGATKLLDHDGVVLSLPGAGLLARLDQHWPLAVAQMQLVVDQARSFQPDRIVNLTPTISARLLARALDMGESQGFTLDEMGFGRYSTSWAAFLQAASAYRGCSPFNLVDLFQRVAGLDPGPFVLKQPGDAAMSEADSLLEGASPLVAFQLGASQDYRRWPVSAFVRAGRRLWAETGCRPVLLGTAGESGLADSFRQQADYPFLDLTGRTSLTILAAVLRRMKLLLTNDTGTMHLAAGLGVPVVAVFLGTAQPFDTGPYLESSLSLEPDMDCHPCSFGVGCPHGLGCRQAIDPDAVGRLLTGFVQRGEWSRMDGGGARLWQARRDGRGYMDLASLSGHDGQPRTLWIRIQREAYRQFLDQRLRAVQPAEAATPPFWAEGLVEELGRALLLLTLIEEQGRLLRLKPIASLRAKFLVNCQNLQDIFSANSALGVLGHLWRYQSQAQAASLDDFLELCSGYRNLLNVLQQQVMLA